jgi:hypothetical protein
VGIGENLLVSNDDGIFLITDGGSSWKKVHSGDMPLRCLAVSGRTVFAYAASKGVFYSTDSGASWNPAGVGWPAGIYVTCLAVSGTHVFAGTRDNGVWGLPLLALSPVLLH